MVYNMHITPLAKKKQSFMKIEIVLSHEHPAQNDNLFRLGYLKVIEEENEIYFFKDKTCMIFLTIDSLAEFLFSKNKHCRWVGEDSNGL